jgi:putative protease
MIELLAPAGSREALIAAVAAGADAVYLAGKSFGARAYADNFSDEELAEAVKFAHLRGVFVYVTVNTLVDNSEIPVMMKYLCFLYEIGVDAIIVQDLGVAHIAKQIAPGLPLHASTQMTIHNFRGVQFLTQYGFKRVVLARELPLNDIEHICKNANTEIEVFTHGALCICYSGQCLMSSMIGGRSGNRGRCAQPCRLPYKLLNRDGHSCLKETGEYLLSPKDLNTIELIPELIKAGVNSFKIEGRMKRPEYVAIVVDVYRRMIDSYAADQQHYSVSAEDRKSLSQIFNRDFTTAYLQGRQGKYMMSDRRPNNRGVRIGRVVAYNHRDKNAVIKLEEPLCVNDIIDFWVKVGGRVSVTVAKMAVNAKETDCARPGEEVIVDVPSPVGSSDRVFKVFDAALMTKARTFLSGLKKIPVSARVDVSIGKPLKIVLTDGEGFSAQAYTGFIAQAARNRPLTRETLKRQIERLGTTAFELAKLEAHIEGEAMIPISELNNVRRRAVEELEKARLKRFMRRPLGNNLVHVTDLLPKIHSPEQRIPQLVVNVASLEALEAAVSNGADIVMFGGETYNHEHIDADKYRQAVWSARRHNKKVILNTPRIVQEWQIAGLESELNLFDQLHPDAVSVGNIGVLDMASQCGGFAVHGDYPLNIYNNVTIEVLRKSGVSSFTLSPELTFSQVEDISSRTDTELECLVHGYLPLMVSEYCMIGSYLGEIHTGKCRQRCMNEQFWLEDRKNIRFPVVTDQYCRMHILNSKELSMLPHVPKFGAIGIGRIRIEGKYFGAEHVGRITRLYRDILDQGKNHKIFRDEDWLHKLEHTDITRGHYFRGVL